MSKKSKMRNLNGIGGSNRAGVTIRFNTEEQANLRSLSQFWGMPAKQVLKFAFEQLVQSTDQLQRKLPVEGEQNAEGTNNPVGSSDVAGSDGASVAAPVDGTDEPGPDSTAEAAS
jgi:hypothetical protein